MQNEVGMDSAITSKVRPSDTKLNKCNDQFPSMRPIMAFDLLDPSPSFEFVASCSVGNNFLLLFGI